MTTKTTLIAAVLLNFLVGCAAKSLPPQPQAKAATTASCAEPEPTPEPVTIGMCR